MNDDSASSPFRKDNEPELWREPWLLRLLHRLGLRSRESFRDDLEDALAESARSDDFSPHERAMLKNILGLHEVRVEDAMVPRADIIAVPIEMTLGELLKMFRSAGHSRLPVYGETLDDPKGMIHIRDVIDFMVSKAEAVSIHRTDESVASKPDLSNVDLGLTLASVKILRPVLYAPPSMPALDLLVRMQTTRTHMALVIDEYGGTDGLVSIEDLVEMIVGDIEDEHDDASAPMIAPSGEDMFVADARASLEEVEACLGIAVANEELAEDIDTIGGLIVTLAGRVPSRGELINGPEGLEFEVLDADPRKVKRVRIHRRHLLENGDIAALPAPPAPERDDPRS